MTGTGRRPSWNQYFMQMAVLASSRSTCTRRKVGAVLVNPQNQIIGTGYNGSPKASPHCTDAGCIRDELGIESGTHHEICRAVHAEQNAVAQAAYQGASTADAALYCPLSPCSICAKILINAGVTRIFYLEKYPDELAEGYLNAAGVQCIQLEEEHAEDTD